MAAKRDYYEVLGVQRGAAQGEISAAYRKLAIRFHPDSNPGDEEATLRFKEAAEAYEVLSDAEKRARYDQYGHAGVDGQAGHAGFGSVDDIMDAFGDIFGSGVFGDMFGGGGRRRRGGRRVRRGADMKVETELTLEEAAKGATKSVRFDRSVRCETCNATGARPGSQPQTCRRSGGRGQVVQSAGILRVQTACPSCRGAGSVITDPCDDCGGHGYQADAVEIEVNIPAGIDHGMRLRLPGEGEPSPDGGPPGDLYCYVAVREHPLFHRDGEHLILDLPISYTQAALGATVEVPTLDGRDELKIPRGTQHGDVFQLRGRGMPNPHGHGVGDLLVRARIEVPKKLDKRQEEILRELADVEHKNVSPERKGFFEKLRDYFGSHSKSEATDQDKEV